jgi:hypothetical protein
MKHEDDQAEEVEQRPYERRGKRDQELIIWSS